MFEVDLKRRLGYNINPRINYYDIMPQLNPEFFLSQLFWLVIIFAMIYGIVAKYFLPRVGNVVDSRNSSIEADVALSEEMLKKRSLNEQDTTKVIEVAKQKAFAILDEATKVAENKLKSSVDEIEKNISKHTAKEEEKLSRFRSQMQHSIEGIALEVQGEIIKNLLTHLDIKSKNN
ncbi:MAG: synthase [Candidatus Midichloriaceae bacterium]|nr:synthase [Candidatus Midichloriaceae bacterium]